MCTLYAHNELNKYYWNWKNKIGKNCEKKMPKK